MFDPVMIRVVRKPLDRLAGVISIAGITPDQVTVAGFGVGVTGVFMIRAQWYTAALVCILVNRIMDGLDGALARRTGKTDAGGFLDICLDFIFYSMTVAGFALADPAANAPAAVILILSFVGTGTSFLAFAVMASKRNIQSVAYPNKSMYYMGGLAEGTETIVFLVFFCLFPGNFPLLAYGFSLLCAITTVTRIAAGYTTLKKE